jgi:hypothetical protein
MNRFLALTALTLISTMASASALDPHHEHIGSSLNQYLDGGPRVVAGVPRFDAPEIDPGSAMAALTLLGGGLVVLVGRFSRKPSRKA